MSIGTTDIGYICILHTWGSTMNFHPHIHAIVLGGGLDVKNHWKDNGKDFFLPIKVISKTFRGKYMAELKQLWENDRLEFHGSAAPYKNYYTFKELLNTIGCPTCRAEYHKALKTYFTAHKDQLCETCNSRLERNPMRILDCKSPVCGEIAKGAPKILDPLL